MDRVNYLFYQLFLKIKYEKRRYFLYVLSFYVGLLLPTCCIANTRSVEQVIYYTTFKGMEDSFQVDWLSRTFNTMVIVETVILAVWACEILTWIIVSRIKKENIADMVRTTRDI